jgi:vitamin B12 transporter
MSTYKNIEKADAKGFEAELGINPLENLTISANYTRTDTRDETNGGPLLYRPRNLSSVVANYVFQKKFQAKIILNYVGERLDYTSGNNTIGKPYTRVDLAGSYTINEHVQLFLRIENLFNTNYQDVRGYDTPGISAFGGVKLSF